MEDPIVLNPLDLIIAGIIIFGMVRGAKKGFSGNINRIVSIGAGVILGWRFKPFAESMYQDYLNVNMSGEIVTILGFATAFAIAYIVVSSVLGFLTKSLDKVNVNIDDALGAVLGGLIYTLGLSVAFIILSYANFPSRVHSQDSYLYPHVRNFSRYAVGLGANALKEANIQINKHGLGAPPASRDAPNPGPPPTSSEKPKAIR
ncbi:MAG: CvpA family protein [Bacteroidota bacterium]